MSKFLKVAFVFSCLSGTAFAGDFNLGRPATPEEIAAWDIDVRPDGLGLPEGSGDVFTGEEVFAERCAVCHGDFGEAVGRWPVLAGGQDSLTDDRPVKSIGSYWPYLSTVWDYVHRAMPFGNAQSLSDDEVYAITAYILYLNDLVDEDFELSHENFADVTLPNESNFYLDDRGEVELAAFGEEPCMENCKDSVEITMRAAVLDVTPEETKARQLRDAVAAAKEGVAPEQVAVAEETPEAEAEPEEMASAPDPALIAAGEKAFKKCKACHQVGDNAKNRSGPVLNGIVGRSAGGIEGFKYSKALKAAAEDGLVWDDASLVDFLTKPRAFLKGTKMSFAGFKKEDEIAAVIAYLKTFE
ncbi:MAG: c-type cytochrome [Silicimonas sp.]|nr:c-type cytochrome [Silicimonas sp.]